MRDSHGSLVVHHHLPPGLDLKAAMVRALAEHANLGWKLESYSSELTVSFCRRGEERRQIGIECMDTAKDHSYANA